MWKLLKDHKPPPLVNILVRDSQGAICIVRTNEGGELPFHRYMMKGHSDFYYSTRNGIKHWVELRAIKMIDVPDNDVVDVLEKASDPMI